MQIETLLKPIC